MKKHSHYRPRDGVLAGIILALCLGFTDVSIAIVTRHPALGSLGAIVPPAGAVAVVVFLAWIAAWFGVFAPLGRLFGANRGATAVSVAFFLGAFFILADLNAYSPFPRNPYKLVLVLLISGIVATGAHFAYQAVAHDGALKTRYRTAVFALPLILGETTFFQWVHHFRVGSFTSGSAMGLGAAWVATVMLTVLAVYRFGHTRFARVFVAAILVGLVSGSVAVLISPQGSSKSGAGAFTGGIKHVVLIIVDTLRADCLTCYNPDAPTTPNIDRLAGESIVFRSAISSAP
ncbi:MAG: sulfatase-like hydrolase/transferase, partial [bacterium]|nr:sulfatase-like hydrolase/transferase [bacterium]